MLPTLELKENKINLNDKSSMILDAYNFTRNQIYSELYQVKRTVLTTYKNNATNLEDATVMYDGILFYTGRVITLINKIRSFVQDNESDILNHLSACMPDTKTMNDYINNVFETEDIPAIDYMTSVYHVMGGLIHVDPIVHEFAMRMEDNAMNREFTDNLLTVLSNHAPESTDKFSITNILDKMQTKKTLNREGLKEMLDFFNRRYETIDYRADDIKKLIDFLNNIKVYAGLLGNTLAVKRANDNLYIIQTNKKVTFDEYFNMYESFVNLLDIMLLACNKYTITILCLCNEVSETVNLYKNILNYVMELKEDDE